MYISMKKCLCKIIFKKELEEEYKILKNDYLKEMQRLQYEIKKKEKKYGIVKQIFDSFPNSEIIGIDCNKKNDELLIVIDTNDTIYLFGEHYQCIKNLPRIFLKFMKLKKEVTQKNLSKFMIF